MDFAIYEQKVDDLELASAQEQNAHLFSLLSSLIDQQKGLTEEVRLELAQDQKKLTYLDRLSKINHLVTKYLDQEAYQKLVNLLHPNYILNEFLIDHTMIEEDTKLSSYLNHNLFLYGDHIKNFRKTKYGIRLDTSMGPITYYQASDRFLEDNERMRELLFHHRTVNGSFRCHELSYDLTRILGATAKTGLLTSLGYRYLHSWVEYHEFAIDIAHNLVLKKKDFSKICEPEIWNTLSFEEMEAYQIGPITYANYKGEKVSYMSLVALAFLHHFEGMQNQDVAFYKIKK